jgi:hypothetical protein
MNTHDIIVFAIEHNPNLCADLMNNMLINLIIKFVMIKYVH